MFSGVRDTTVSKEIYLLSDFWGEAPWKKNATPFKQKQNPGKFPKKIKNIVLNPSWFFPWKKDRRKPSDSLVSR